MICGWLRRLWWWLGEKAVWECLSCGYQQTYESLDKHGNCGKCRGPVILAMLLWPFSFTG